MNITYTKKDNTIIHFYDGIKKYEHYKNSDGYEEWKEYDEKGNEIHYKNSNGYERWKEYDKEGNEIHYKNSIGYEEWKEYDKKGNEIHYKDSSGYERWSDDNPNNPKNRPIVDDCEPFSFGGELKQ